MRWINVAAGMFLCLVVAPPGLAGQRGARVDIATISPCPSFCGGSGAHTEFLFDGGVGANSAWTLVDNIDGTGEASASLNGPLELPSLGVEAFSNPNARVSSSAIGVQQYIYDGAAPKSVALDLILTGEAGAAQPTDASVRADIAVVSGPRLDFLTDFSTLIFEVVPLTPSLDLLAQASLILPVNAGPQSVTDQLAFDLAPGDSIFIWAGLTGRGTRSGFGDALDTLKLEFPDPAGLTVVPEPSGWLLCLMGLALLLITLPKRPRRTPSGIRGRRAPC